MNFLKSLPLRKSDFNSISQSSFILDNTEMSKISMIIDYYVDNYVSNVLEISNQVVRTQSWISVNITGFGLGSSLYKPGLDLLKIRKKTEEVIKVFDKVSHNKLINI